MISVPKLITFVLATTLLIIIYYQFFGNFATIAQILTGKSYEPLRIKTRTNKQFRIFSSQLELCQPRDRFIIFQDVDQVGAGFLHKFEDFQAACELAIRTGRTLVDYSPRLEGAHLLRNRQSYPEMRKMFLPQPGPGYKTEWFQGSDQFLVLKRFMPGWTFGDYFDFSNLTYNLQYANASVT